MSSLRQKPVKTNVIVGDPVSDFLTRIRNAGERYHGEVRMPSSRMKEEVARVLHEEGYISAYEVQGEGPTKLLVIKLKYKGKRGRERVITGLERVSKPSRRIYVGADDIPFVMGGMGITVLSTSQGIMTGHQAKESRIGGEVLCNVW